MFRPKLHFLRYYVIGYGKSKEKEDNFTRLPVFNSWNTLQRNGGIILWFSARTREQDT